LEERKKPSGKRKEKIDNEKKKRKEADEGKENGMRGRKVVEKN